MAAWVIRAVDLVGLVDHHDVVLRDHRHSLDRVDREQAVVGDHQLGLGGALLGPLGEALVAERAARLAQALAGTDRDLPPEPVGVPGRIVPLPVPLRLALVLGPLAQLEDLLAHRALGYVDQHALLVGHALADPVQAGVVGAALEHGVGRRDAGLVLDRLDQPREVPLDQLVLQREGRGGDHDPAVVQQRRHQVGQRLAGAGAGLDEQVLAVLERVGDRLGHLDLAGAAPDRRAPRRPRPARSRTRLGAPVLVSVTGASSSGTREP